MHWIQTHILEQLISRVALRNRDLRPDRVESSLFQYHLGCLVRDGFVERHRAGYRLAPKGRAWADRYSSELKDVRLQTKLITVLALHRADGAYLLIPKARQPFLNWLYLPSGKVRLGEGLIDAAQRELYEKLSIRVDKSALTAVGSARICIRQHC